jgi:hypothetical protein
MLAKSKSRSAFPQIDDLKEWSSALSGVLSGFANPMWFVVLLFQFAAVIENPRPNFEKISLDRVEKPESVSADVNKHHSALNNVSIDIIRGISLCASPTEAHDPTAMHE